MSCEHLVPGLAFVCEELRIRYFNVSLLDLEYRTAALCAISCYVDTCKYRVEGRQSIDGTSAMYEMKPREIMTTKTIQFYFGLFIKNNVLLPRFQCKLTNTNSWFTQMLSCFEILHVDCRRGGQE